MHISPGSCPPHKADRGYLLTSFNGTLVSIHFYAVPSSFHVLFIILPEHTRACRENASEQLGDGDSAHALLRSCSLILIPG